MIRSLTASSCDPNHLPGQLNDLSQRLIDSRSEGSEVGVFCAKDHATVGKAGIVQVSKVLPVVRQHGPSAGMRECQHVLVSDTQTSQACLRDCQHIMAELPQRLDRGAGKILVREKEGQSLGLLVLSDLTINFFAVVGNERPSVHQIGCAECGECNQDLGFRKPQPPIVLQRPYRDSGPSDSSITAANGCR
jgi:hypothetical protein